MRPPTRSNAVPGKASGQSHPAAIMDSFVGLPNTVVPCLESTLSRHDEGVHIAAFSRIEGSASSRPEARISSMIRRMESSPAHGGIRHELSAPCDRQSCA